MNLFRFDPASVTPKSFETPSTSHLDISRSRTRSRVTVGLLTVIGIAAIVAFSSFLLADWQTNPALMLAGGVSRLVVLVCTVTLIGRAIHLKHTARNETLSVVLNNMPQGICMFDSEKRVIISNRLFARMYGLADHQLTPGTTITEIQAAGQPGGIAFCCVSENYLSDHFQGHETGRALIHQLPDGRSISLSSMPMPGGGWLAVHEDITQRRLAELERDKTRTLLDKIVEHVPSAILVKGATDGRYVLANSQAVALIGTPREGILGKSVSDIDFCAATERMTDDDDDILRSCSRRESDVYAVTTAHRGQRLITNTKLLIHAENGEPEFIVDVINDVTERELAAAHLAHMAHHDALTGLPNRVHFQGALKKALAGVSRGERLAVLYLDLDNFKSVNDTFGHSVGDELLISVAARLNSCVRGTDTIARLGGDEFAIVQTGLSDRDDATGLANRLISAFAQPIDVGSKKLVTAVSIGIALAPADGIDAEDLLKRSDMALFEAKAAGRRTYCFFQARMDARLHRRFELGQRFQQALDQSEFEVHYQAIMDVHRWQICGAEALARWRHPVKGLLLPSEFIPIAEDNGLIVALGEWILRCACMDAAGWPPDVKVAVNLSPVQLMNQSLVETVASALEHSGLAPERLELEITEAVFLKDSKATLTTLQRLRGLGVQVVMDDFGTGYSSLSYLRSFPFDKIKIDRSFISDLPGGGEAAKIVAAIIGLATSLGMRTTAEGVETREQIDLLRNSGCTEMQGYWFGRPISCASMQTLLSARLVLFVNDTGSQCDGTR